LVGFLVGLIVFFSWSSATNGVGATIGVPWGPPQWENNIVLPH